MTKRYPSLPKLSADEFNELACVLRERYTGRSHISDASITMARRVLFDDMSYQDAAQACGRPNASSARQAVEIILRHIKPAEIVHPHTLFRRTCERNVHGAEQQGRSSDDLTSKIEPRDNAASNPIRYPNLPQLTENEFDTLASMARSRQWRRSGNLMSLCSIDMARAVLLNGASYKEATEASGQSGFSPARKAVHALLKYREKSGLHIDEPYSSEA